MTERPLVTIITPAFNSGRTISDTLSSIAGQTYSPIEHVVVDAGSSDDTLEIVRSFSRNSTIRVISEPDDGIYDAMNKGIRNSQGRIIGIVNSDDFLADSTTIQRVVDAFCRDSADLVYGDVDLVAPDDVSRVVRHWNARQFRKGSFARGWHPPHPGVFVLKDVYENHGLFDQSYRIAADFELLLRFFEHGDTRITYLPIVIARMRLGGASTGSIKNIIRGNLECMRAFRRNGLKIPLSYPLLRLVPKLTQFLHAKT